MNKRFFGKVFLFLMLCIVLLTVYCLFGTGLDIHKTENGWICFGPIQYGIRTPKTRPILCDQEIVILEKYKNNSSKKNFLRDDYYLTVLAIDDGNIISRTKLRFEKHPLQVKGMWPWNDKIVIWGYHQNEPGLNTRIYNISILDIKGHMIKKFGLDSSANPMAIDESNNLLLCRCKYPETLPEIHDIEVESPDMNTFVYLYDLISGKTKFREQLDDMFEIITDNNGNAYFLRRTIIDVDKDLYGAILEKYSIEPWEHIWSISIEGLNRKYPITASYQDGLIWYAMYDEEGGSSVEEKIEWVNIPIDAQTGLKTESKYEFNPYIKQIKLKDKVYKINYQNGKLEISIISK